MFFSIFNSSNIKGIKACESGALCLCFFCERIKHPSAGMGFIAEKCFGPCHQILLLCGALVSIYVNNEQILFDKYHNKFQLEPIMEGPGMLNFWVDHSTE